MSEAHQVEAVVRCRYFGLPSPEGESITAQKLCINSFASTLGKCFCNISVALRLWWQDQADHDKEKSSSFNVASSISVTSGLVRVSLVAVGG